MWGVGCRVRGVGCGVHRVGWRWGRGAYGLIRARVDNRKMLAVGSGAAAGCGVWGAEVLGCWGAELRGV